MSRLSKPVTMKAGKRKCGSHSRSSRTRGTGQPRVRSGGVATASSVRTPAFQLVRITKKGGTLSKRISRDSSGSLVVDNSACALNAGKAATVRITEGMKQLKALYAGLADNEAVVFSNVDLGDQPRDICTESVYGERKKTNKDIITRTKRFFPAASAPGLLLFEVDDHGLPPGRNPPDGKGMLELLTALLPELDVPGAARLLTHSTSSFIYDAETGDQIKGEGGKHLAILVSDQSAIHRLRELLEIRQWAQGHGHIYVSRDGRQIERTTFDLSVFAPERLVFEAGAKLGADLKQRRPEAEAVEGHALDMSKLPAITLAERERADRVKSQAKAVMRDEAEKVKSDYIRLEAEKLVALRGVSSDEAKQIVAIRAETGMLNDGDVLTFTDRGSSETQTVGHVLDHIEQFIGRAMCDPTEPEYGPSKAMILRGPGGQPFVHSFAHGGRRFLFQRHQGVEGAADRALFPLSDLANAHRIVRAFSGQLISTATGWYVYDGRHWKKGDQLAEQKAFNLSRLVLNDPAYVALKKRFDENGFASPGEAENAEMELKSWRQFAQSCENRSKIAAALNMARVLLWRDMSDLNPDPMLFNVMNGTIDLRTGQLRPHDPEDLITMLAPVNYVPDAQCPTFEKIVLEIFDGDANVVDFMQRFFGYSLTGMTTDQVMLIPWGDGSNGKSTLLGVIQQVMGKDYCGPAAPKLLEGTRSDRHPTEIADLYGKRLVIASEAEEGSQLREAFLKLATGGDVLKGRFMHKDFFEFEPTHKFVLQTNHKPEVKGVDYGIWRRLLLVPFEVTFGDQAAIDAGEAKRLKDKDLPAKLASEQEGVLAWMVRGCMDWQKQGLAPPEKVQAATSTYRGEQDRIGQFIDERCELATKYSIARDDLYRVYCVWAEQNGYFPLGINKFHRQLIKAGSGKIESAKSTTGPRKNITIFNGITIFQKGNMHFR